MEAMIVGMVCNFFGGIAVSQKNLFLVSHSHSFVNTICSHLQLRKNLNNLALILG